LFSSLGKKVKFEFSSKEDLATAMFEVILK